MLNEKKMDEFSCHFDLSLGARILFFFGCTESAWMGVGINGSVRLFEHQYEYERETREASRPERPDN